MRSLKLFAAALSVVVATSGAAQEPGAVTPQGNAAASDDYAAAPAPSGHALDQADLDVWLDGFMPYALKTGDIPGAVVVVVGDGRVLTQRGFGYADVEQRKRVDPERTLFRPGSVSKLFTWTAVMQLVEEGKLDLDQDVNEYLDFRVPLRDGQPATLRQIMTHTAGFEESAKNLIFFDAEQLVPLGDHLKAWVPNRVFEPGSTPAYSNYATTLAGYIVERVSGQSFDDYLDEHIFAPLDMQNSTFRQPLPERLAGMMSRGYSPTSAEPVEFEIVGPAPAGSLSSTGADMAKFMLAHLQQGGTDEGRILRPETARMMHDTPLTMLPPLNRMELGFFETNINGRQVIAHLGDTVAFHTSLHLFLEEGVGLYFSANSSGREGAVQGLRSALFEEFADRYFPAETAVGASDVAPQTNNAEKLVGVWRVSRRSESNFFALLSLLGQVKISLGPDGELVVPLLRGLNGKPRKWVEVEPFVWHDPDSHERLAAVVEDGEVVRWSVDLLSPFMVFDRVPAGQSSAWLFPALGIGLGALALTFLLWPVAALVRRHYGAPLAVEGPERVAYRCVRIFSGLILAVLIGWAVTITTMMKNIEKLTSVMDPWLWLLQIAGLVVFVGGLAVMVWNAWLVWRGKRRWTSKLWSVVLVLGAAIVLWAAFAFRLLALTVSY